MSFDIPNGGLAFGSETAGSVLCPDPGRLLFRAPARYEGNRQGPVGFASVCRARRRIARRGYSVASFTFPVAGRNPESTNTNTFKDLSGLCSWIPGSRAT